MMAVGFPVFLGSIKPLLREANRYADGLARMGSQENIDFSLYDTLTCGLI